MWQKLWLVTTWGDTSKRQERERIYGGAEEGNKLNKKRRKPRVLSRKLAPPFILDFLRRKTISHCHVPLHMQRKMVWPAKGPFAQPALERTVASMFSGMSGQLIGSGKLPAAAFPSAYIRLFAGMCSLVSFQVTRLGVGFGATFLRTMVNDSFAFGPGSSLSRFGNFPCFG